MGPEKKIWTHRNTFSMVWKVFLTISDFFRHYWAQMMHEIGNFCLKLACFYRKINFGFNKNILFDGWFGQPDPCTGGVHTRIHSHITYQWGPQHTCKEGVLDAPGHLGTEFPKDSKPKMTKIVKRLVRKIKNVLKNNFQNIWKISLREINIFEQAKGHI